VYNIISEKAVEIKEKKRRLPPKCYRHLKGSGTGLADY
jgi:hypothetical protein